MAQNQLTKKTLAKLLQKRTVMHGIKRNLVAAY